MSKITRLTIRTAENGGLVFVKAAPSARPSDDVGPEMYICKELDPQSVGETILQIMAIDKLRTDPISEIEI